MNGRWGCGHHAKNGFRLRALGFGPARVSPNQKPAAATSKRQAAVANLERISRPETAA